MTADEMAELIVLWRFLVLPRDVVFDIIDANKWGVAFAPDPRGLKRIWKDMKRSQKEFLFEDYDRSNDEFSSERQAKLREVVDEAVEFDEHLYSRSYDEIAALYAECQIEQTAEDDQDRSMFDQHAFFNEPDAEADSIIWMQMPFWTADEATALSFGKNPQVVSTKSLKRIKKAKSNFVRAYAFRRAAIERAVDEGQLKDPIPRADFIAWALAHQVPLPEGLATQTAHIQASSEHSSSGSSSRPPRQRNQASVEQGARTRERNSMLAIIAIMARAKYGMRHAGEMPRVVYNILQDAKSPEVEMKIKADTVRKYLGMAFGSPAMDDDI